MMTIISLILNAGLDDQDAALSPMLQSWLPLTKQKSKASP